MKSSKLISIAAAALMLGATTASAAPRHASGTITIDETQFSFLIGGNTGGGTLHFHGKSYPFKIGGVAVGNIGVTHVRGYGEVYNLKSPADLGGTYVDLQASATAGKGQGALRLQKDEVELDLHTRSGGLQLSAGGGGVKITMK